jgi:hypothetical protein
VELICKGCHEDAEHGHPKDITTLMPQDRRHYRHKGDRTALCPEVGIGSNGKSSYIPCLPIEKRTRR